MGIGVEVEWGRIVVGDRGRDGVEMGKVVVLGLGGGVGLEVEWIRIVIGVGVGWGWGRWLG